MAPAICTEPGCPVEVVVGRCPAHRRRDHRPSAASRGYDHRWRILRAAYLRAHPTCVTCGAPATDVDHIDGRGPAGDNRWTNLRALCHPCHSRRTAVDQRLSEVNP